MSTYIAGGLKGARNCNIRSMKWYMVTKNIGGRPYLYRQRTYREGGKVRTQCQYVGAAGDNAVGLTPNQIESVSAPDVPLDEEYQEPGTLPINWENAANPFWPSIRKLHAERAKTALKRDNVSISAMKGEYARVSKQLQHLALDGSRLSNIRLLEGKKAGWKRNRSGYQVTLAPGASGSGRNRFKQHYRLALAHGMLDEIECQSPSLYDGLRTVMDRSWFNTKMLVTLQILGQKASKGKGTDPSRIWMTMQFLWSGELPKAMEKQLGKNGIEKKDWTKPAAWRDEAATLIADVMQRGYKSSLKKLAKDRSKSKASAKRAFTAYRKLNRLQRLTSKGRKKWKIYKKHEASFLLAHHRQSRLEMLKPFLGDFHKSRR